MTTTNLANPRRTSLSGLSKGSELATCEQSACHNVAVLVVDGGSGRRMVCRVHAAS